MEVPARDDAAICNLACLVSKTFTVSVNDPIKYLDSLPNRIRNAFFNLNKAMHIVYNAEKKRIKIESVPPGVYRAFHIEGGYFTMLQIDEDLEVTPYNVDRYVNEEDYLVNPVRIEF